MLTAIVAKLKTGQITNVVPYGVKTLPAPPYIVVKTETAPGNQRRFRVIVHMQPGQQTFLEDYVFNAVSVLLKSYEDDGRHGNHFQLDEGLEYNDIVANNDDGTISMERVYYAPKLLF